MRKPRTVLQLVILSVQLLTSSGLAEIETSHTISITCQTYLANQTSSNHINLCKTLETPLAQHCSEEDLQHVCNVSSAAAIATQLPVTSDIITAQVPCKELTLQLVIDGLSDRCKNTMSDTLKDLQSRGDSGCSSLEWIKNHLISNAICTLGDYDNMRSVICRQSVDPRDIAGNIKRRENILTTLNTFVSKSCQKVLTQQAHDISEDLDAGCLKLKNGGNRLIRDGSCNAKDIEILLNEACVETFANDGIKRVVQNEITGKCHLALTTEATDITGLTAEECCGKLKAYKDMLWISGFCTEEDYRKLAQIACGRGAHLSMSSLALYMVTLVTFFWFLNDFTTQ